MTRNLRLHLSIVLLSMFLASARSSVAAELAEDSLRATVRITNGSKSSTGFFVTARDKTDTGMRHLFVTAAHVFGEMPEEKCKIVFRTLSKETEYVRTEAELAIRNGDTPLWVRHPDVDVAVIAVNLPKGVDVKPFDEHQIAEARLAEERLIRVGQDVFIPCFPAGVEANSAGWPILRKGSVATHPLRPLASAKTMFVDYSHFGGDSGAPVVTWIENEPIVVGLVIGMLRQTDKSSTAFEERTFHTSLGLAISVQSPLIRQTIDEWRK